MHTKECWDELTRIIEFGPRDGRLGDALLHSGHCGYLAVLRDRDHRQAICKTYPHLASFTTVSASSKAVRQNNADVLILHGAACLKLARHRSVRHARYVAWQLRPSVTLLIATLIAAIQWLLRRYSSLKIANCAPQGQPPLRLVVAQNRRPRPHTATRRFIPHQMGIEGFLRRLTSNGVRHVVLRWFEDLPELPAGEDLDLLVADCSLESVRTWLAEGPGIQPIDLYSVTGLPGSDYRKMPYFAPYLAEQILEHAQEHRGLCRVPSPEDHFLSLSYHALYHKGTRSGLSYRRGVQWRRRPPEHDYAVILRNHAHSLGIAAEVTLEGLDRYLDSCGWRPPHDMLVRLSRKNKWLRTLLDQSKPTEHDRQLAVFLIRQEAMRRGGIPRAIELLEREGFHILLTKELSESESQRVGQCIRGGNWGRGPWSISGGLPVAALVTYDASPLLPTRRQRRRQPFVANARLFWKNRIRDSFNDGCPEDQHCNVIHSSDNGREAMDYLRIIMPDEIDQVLQRVAELDQQCATGVTVRKTLTRSGRRAKIEVVDRGGRVVVRKTFKPHQERYCRRETAALRALQAVVPEIPPVLESDKLSLTLPFYDNVMTYQRSSGKMLPIDIARQAIEALRKVYAAGYAQIDASIDNILVDRHEGLKLIDFEFSHRYEQQPTSFERSYDIEGIPSDYPDDEPQGGAKNYDKNWRPYIGLSFRSLQQDARWLQHVKRTIYFVTHAHRFVPRLLRFYLLKIVAKVQRDEGGARSQDQDVRRAA
jgi:hypothetical protein